MSDDWEYSESNCPKCSSQMAWRRCYSCEDGYYAEYDDFGGRDRYRCETCNGTGHEEWCRECGWDATYNQFLSPKYEQEFLEKQGQLNGQARR